MLLEPDGGDEYAVAAAALDAAEALTPGVELVAACEATATLPLGVGEAVRLAVLWERVASWVAVRQLRAQRAVLDHDNGSSDVAQALISELAAASAVSDSTMGNSLGVAVGIVGGLPAMAAVVEAGELTIRHAKALDAVVGQLDGSLRQQVEVLVVPLAIERRLTPFQLRKAAELVVLRLDPDGAVERREAARRQESDVRYRTIGDGLAALTATGDDMLLRQVADAIDDKTRQLAAPSVGDPATETDVDTAPASAAEPDETPVGVRRVSALARLVLGDEQVDRPRVEVAVTIDYRSLLGLTDTPAQVSGVGVIPSVYARRLATDAIWRRLVTDPMTGHCLDLGGSAYRPSAALQRLVVAEHGVCRFPGCARPARSADIDHIVNFGAGRTDRDNLHPLCRRHHNLKTRCLWHVMRHPDGSETWTGPAGVAYSTEPADYRETRTVDDQEPHGTDPPDHIGPDDTQWLATLFADSQDFDTANPDLVMIDVDA